MRSISPLQPIPGLVLSLAALLGLSLLTLGATIVVDDDGGTPDLQTALDSAQPGDTIFVMPGLYTGLFVVPADVDLIGAGAEITTLDGLGQGTTVTVQPRLSTGSTVRGFTITGGSESGLRYSLGRGVVEDNIIAGNHGFAGGGAYLSGCPLEFRRNVVRDNEATDEGGGIYVVADGSCPHPAWDMGAAAVQITNNVIRTNLAAQGGGVAVFRYYGDRDLPSITHNTIVGNTAAVAGGISVRSDLQDWTPYVSTGRITNNVITGSTGGGVQVSCDYFGYACGASYTIGYPEVTGNLVYDNGAFEISGGPSGLGMNGNISADPEFKDASSWDLRLGGASPCLDAGAVLSSFEVTDGHRGMPRPADGDLDGVALPDMGAFEDQGDVDGLTLHGGGETLSWQARDGVAAYHLYRGDLPTLLAGGAYTQDPLSVPAARQWCDLAQPTFNDTDTPAIGTPYFYLVTPVGLVEGALGLDGDLQSRPNDNPCP